MGNVALADDGPACGNNSQGGPKKDKCEESTDSSITPYTGNEHRVVKELEVWGSVGKLPLNWTRYYNSRFINDANLFGNTKTWRHSYQWEIAVETSAGAISRIKLFYPDGTANDFTPSGTANKFVSTPAIRDVCYLNAAGDTLTLQRPEGSRYRFKRVGSSWLLDTFLDREQNLYTMTYGGGNQLTRISDASGRYLRITYQTLPIGSEHTAILAWVGSHAEGQWNTVNVTVPDAFTFLRYQGADGSASAVAEVRLTRAVTRSPAPCSTAGRARCPATRPPWPLTATPAPGSRARAFPTTTRG